MLFDYCFQGCCFDYSTISVVGGAAEEVIALRVAASIIAFRVAASIIAFRVAA